LQRLSHVSEVPQPSTQPVYPLRQDSPHALALLKHEGGGLHVAATSAVETSPDTELSVAGASSPASFETKTSKFCVHAPLDRRRRTARQRLTRKVYYFRWSMGM
jgi:hypothetical protein